MSHRRPHCKRFPDALSNSTCVCVCDNTDLHGRPLIRRQQRGPPQHVQHAAAVRLVHLPLRPYALFGLLGALFLGLFFLVAAFAFVVLATFTFC